MGKFLSGFAWVASLYRLISHPDKSHIFLSILLISLFSSHVTRVHVENNVILFFAKQRVAQNMTNWII